jgi:hypothetical protein
MHSTSPLKWTALRALLLGFGLALGGCSSFNKEWKAAASPAPSDSLEGRWEGQWRSEENRHHDSLRCLIRRGTNETYTARFHAKYWAVFHVSFSYTVPLTVQRQGDGFQFEGSANLGSLAGGLYTYKGHATTTNFVSTYSCKYDHGVFEMTRPPAPK